MDLEGFAVIVHKGQVAVAEKSVVVALAGNLVLVEKIDCMGIGNVEVVPGAVEIVD